jgi:hypothetical protein
LLKIFFHQYTENCNTKQNRMEIVEVMQVWPEAGIIHLHGLVVYAD